MAIKRVLAVVAVGAIVASAGVAVSSMPAVAGVYLGGVSMQGACDNQYPGQGRRAVVRDQRNAYSWRCGTGVVPVADGGIDVNRQCRAQYGSAAYAGLSNAGNPYSWYCQR